MNFDIFPVVLLILIFSTLIVCVDKTIKSRSIRDFARLSNEIQQVVAELVHNMNQAAVMTVRVQEHDEQLRVLEREYGELFGGRSNDSKLEEIAVQHFVLHDSRQKLSKLAGTLTARARAALSSLQSLAVKLEQPTRLPAANLIWMQAQRLREGLSECDSLLRKIESAVKGLSAEQTSGQTAGNLFAGSAGAMQNSRSVTFLAAARRNIELQLVLRSAKEILRRDGGAGS